MQSDVDVDATITTLLSLESFQASCHTMHASTRQLVYSGQTTLMLDTVSTTRREWMSCTEPPTRPLFLCPKDSKTRKVGAKTSKLLGTRPDTRTAAWTLRSHEQRGEKFGRVAALKRRNASGVVCFHTKRRGNVALGQAVREYVHRTQHVTCFIARTPPNRLLQQPPRRR